MGDIKTNKNVKLIEEKQYGRFIFKPNDSFKSKWDLVIMLSALFNCFTIPFKVSFNPDFMETQIFKSFNSIIDFIFALDIIITFRTALIDSYGNEISTPIEIAKHYVKASFWIDLCATIPIDQIIESFANKSNAYYEMFGILKLGRVLRLNKIIAFLNVEEDVKATMKLTKMVFFLMVYIHFFACLWFLFVKNNQLWVPIVHLNTDNWYQLYTSGILEQYLVCVHSAVLSTLGSDILP